MDNYAVGVGEIHLIAEKFNETQAANVQSHSSASARLRLSRWPIRIMGFEVLTSRRIMDFIAISTRDIRLD